MRLTNSVRRRLMASIVALVVVVATVLSLLAYTIVSRDLRNQLEDRAVQGVELVVTSLAPARLPTSPTLEDVTASGLIADLDRTAAGYSVRDRTETFSSGFAFAAEPDPGLIELMAAGRVGLQWLEGSDGRPYVVSGARLPPSGPDFVLWFDASPVEETLDTLAWTLAIGSAALVAVALLTARVASRRILVPVAAAASGARMIAQGDLGVRLEVDSADAMGELASSFNTMADALSEQMAALQRAEADQRRFVADVSHELRTPLTALVHEAGLIREALEPLPAPNPRLGEMLHDDVGRLRRLVEDLLEISRLDADTPGFDVQRVDVGEFLGALIATRMPSATLSVDPPGVVVSTDRRRLERIVSNLLDNAAKHAQGSEVAVAARLDSDMLAVAVADRGPGLREDDRERVFDRFVKVDPARSEGGSGLGLAIAAGHARSLGGTLRYHPRRGGGASFELVVPVTELLPGGETAVTSREDTLR